MSAKIKKIKNMMFHNLQFEIIAYLFLSMLISIFITFNISKISLHVIRNYFEPVFIEKEAEQVLLLFQKYITENKITMDNQEKLYDWSTPDNPVIIILNPKEIGLLFNTEENRPAFFNDLTSSSRVFKYNRWKEVEKDITYFDNTEASIIICVTAEILYKYFIAGTLIFVFIIFLIIFYYMLKRKLNYISIIEQGVFMLESGNLNHKVPVKGNDELGRLSISINSMSQSFVEKNDSEKRAVQISKEIINDLSHDIRTPLTILSGYVPILLESDSLTESQEQYLKLIMNKTEQMKKRIDELLDYSTIYSGKREVNLYPLQIGVLLSQLKQEMSLLKVEIKDYTNPDSIIYVDPGLIERVFDNILSNIHKYADFNKIISFYCKEIDGSVILEIKNATLNTSSIDSKSLGIRISSYIMECLNGKMETYEQDGWFYCVLMLPLAEYKRV